MRVAPDLSAMRYVLRNPEEKDRSWRHKNLRQFFKDKPSQFMEQLRKLDEAENEKLERKQQLKDEQQARQEGKSEPGEEDVGGEKCLELVGRLLAEFGGGA